MNYFSTTLNQSLKHYAFFASFFWLKFTFGLPNKNGLNCEIDIIIFVQMTKTRENTHSAVYFNSLPDASVNTAHDRKSSHGFLDSKSSTIFTGDRLVPLFNTKLRF